MIVRNESRIIQRLLDSLAGVVCECVVVDTGPTDNTIELIENHPIPSFVTSRPFDNFGKARSHALTVARKHATAEWLLLMDADMTWKGGPLVNLDDADVVSVIQKGSGLEYHNVRLVRKSLAVTCVGPTHEYYDYPSTARHIHITSHYIQDIGDGGCKHDKYTRDLDLLLKHKPRNARTTFYLAQTYSCLGDTDNALAFYIKRMKMNNSFELERDYARYKALSCYLKQNKLSEAQRLFSGTKEDCLEIATFLRNKSDWVEAMAYACKGIMAEDRAILFKEISVETRLLFERTILWHYVYPDLPKVGLSLSLDLLNSSDISKDIRAAIWSNLRFYVKTIGLQTIERRISSEAGWHCSTPSSRDLIRLVNYSINSNGGYVVDGPVRSRLENITVRSDYLSEDYIHKDAHCLGIEDVRIAPDGQNVLCSSLEFTHTKGTVAQVKGLLRNTDLWLDYVVPSTKHEKNWVWVGDRVVYAWWPYVSIGVVTETGFQETSRITPPRCFEGMRGSSNGVQWQDGILFVTHTSIDTPNQKRQYVHHLVVLDATLTKVLRYTLPFTFTGNDVEFCMYLNDNLEVGFSERDNTTVFATLCPFSADWICVS